MIFPDGDFSQGLYPGTLPRDFWAYDIMYDIIVCDIIYDIMPRVYNIIYMPLVYDI